MPQRGINGVNKVFIITEIPEGPVFLDRHEYNRWGSTPAFSRPAGIS